MCCEIHVGDWVIVLQLLLEIYTQNNNMQNSECLEATKMCSEIHVGGWVIVLHLLLEIHTQNSSNMLSLYLDVFDAYHLFV